MIKKRILLIGSNGLLGQRTAEFFKNKAHFEFLASSVEDHSFNKEVQYQKADITDKKEIKKLFKTFYPDFVINCAAYTAVDKCEIEKDLAYKINVTGVENIVHYSNFSNTHVIHVSSDYIFDGENGPYSETDLPNPISYYGRTKLAAENVVRAAECSNTILRTNVLYGVAKNEFFDFVKWVIKSLRDGKSINIVNDQINNPTFTDDLISAFIRIVDSGKTGIFNIGGKEFLSRLDFTYKIADFFQLDKNLINPIKTSELNLPAPRPLKSGLITLKAETELRYSPTELNETFAIIKNSLQ